MTRGMQEQGGWKAIVSPPLETLRYIQGPKYQWGKQNFKELEILKENKEKTRCASLI